MRRYLVLAALALIAFGDSLRGSFHFDDYAMLAAPHGPEWLLQTRPLTQLSFWLNYLASGSNPALYHLVNLFLHIAVACLLYQLLCELIPEDAAFFSACLFAIHPIQSEAVAYVFARSTLLAALFCLLSWRAWQRDKSTLSVLFFTAALVSKEECITFPFVMMLFGPRRWKPFAAMLGLSLATGLHTVYATLAVKGSGAGFTAGISPLDYLMNQGYVIARYLGLLLFPWGFTIDAEIRPALWEQVAAWAAVIAALFYFRRNRWVLAAALLIIPSSTIFPAADLAADRRMYLPMLALSIAIIPLFQRWKYFAAVVFIVLSIGRMEVWRTERTLWQEAVERSPDKLRPKLQLARALAPQEALAVLSAAPPVADVLTERGRIYLDLHQPADALREFGQALALSPRDPHAINNRGVALLALGQNAAAKLDFERALTLDPTLPDARLNLTRITAAAK